jgi:Ras family protein T1
MREVGQQQLSQLLGRCGAEKGGVALSPSSPYSRSGKDSAITHAAGTGGGDPEAAQSPKAFFASCDVAVFLFDSSSPESFREAHRQLQQVASASGDTLPCLLVAAKDDLGMSQALLEECGAACEALAMPMPVAVSMRLGVNHCIYARVAEAAQKAHRHIPETDTLKTLREHQRTLRLCLVAAGAGVVVVSVAYTLYSWWTGKERSSGGSYSKG